MGEKIKIRRNILPLIKILLTFNDANLLWLTAIKADNNAAKVEISFILQTTTDSAFHYQLLILEKDKNHNIKCQFFFSWTESWTMK